MKWRADSVAGTDMGIRMLRRPDKASGHLFYHIGNVLWHIFYFTVPCRRNMPLRRSTGRGASRGKAFPCSIYLFERKMIHEIR